MPVNPASDGALQLKALGVKLKALGKIDNIGPAENLGVGRSLRAQLLAGIRAAAKPAVVAAQEAARRELPKHGGLNEYVATTQIVTSARTAGSQVGVRIGVKKGPKSNKAFGANKGTVRHPVFGHRDRKWSDTKVTPGWFDESLRKAAPATIGPITAVMEKVAIEITRRV